MSTTIPAGGEALLLAALPVVDEVVAFVCRRQSCREEEREEFAARVRLRLVEDDYAVLRRFGGRSSLRTYMCVVVQRLFLDHRRSRWGVWRPSAEARRLGPEAVRLDVLLHRDGLGLEEAIERLRRNEGVPTPPAELRRLAARLPVRHRRRTEDESVLESLPLAAAETAEALAMAAERTARAEALRKALDEALATLSPTDVALVRLRFFDGFSVKRVAEWLGVPAKPLYRRLERLLAGLRAGLEARGFAAGELAGLIGDGAFERQGTWPATGDATPGEGQA